MILPGAPLLAGLALSIAVMAGTLAIAAYFPTETFPSVLYACQVNGLSAGDCQAMAREAGLYSLAIYVAILGAMLWRGWAKAPAGAVATAPAATPSQQLFVTGALGLFGLHLALILFGPVHVSRLNQTEYYSTLISLENLILPALLQLYVAAPSRSPLRLPLLAALLMGMFLSPYRAMLMAVFLFGLALPFLMSAWETWRERPAAERRWRDLAVKALVVATIGGTLVFAGIQDTQTRSPTLLGISLGLTDLPSEQPLPSVSERFTGKTPQMVPGASGSDGAGKEKTKASHDALLPPTDLISRVSQRIVFPLYQSAIAGHLAETDMELPTLTDQVLRKLRLSDAPNLEEFLFRRIYGGDGHGQTTSLTFGEASVYFPAAPILWMLAVPLLLVLSWRLLSRQGLACGTLFGFALWRTSFSGLFPILPSLLIQTAGLWVLHRFPMRPLAGLARFGLSITLVGTLALSGYMAAVQISGQRDFLYASFELAPGCWLQSPTWVPKVVGDVGTNHGLPMRPVLTAHHRTAVALALPYGETAVPLLDDVRGAIASMSRCQSDPGTKAEASAVRLLEHHVVKRAPDALNILVLATLAMAIFAAWRRRHDRTESSR